MRIIIWPSKCFALATVLVTVIATVSRAATLMVTPATISNLYSGNITLQVTGLSSGETVVVERFVDLDANNVVNAGEPLVQSFRLTDGQVTSIGGVRNASVPGDNDLLANGQIPATLNFVNGAEFSRGSGNQIFRVSSPGATFTPVQQTLTVTQSPYPQQITGTVSSSGTPIPFALVGVLVQVGNDNQFISGTVANASGNFSLNVSNGTYQVIGFKSGYIGSFATSPLVTVSGSSTNVTVPLSVASLSVSGAVTETGSGAGIPGIQFFTSSTNNEYTVFFSDAQGNFSAALINGQWTIETADAALVLGGYFRSQNKTKVDVLSANVTGVSIPFMKGTALIYGTLRDEQNNPLAGVRFYDSDSGNVYQSTAITDAGGNFFVPVTNGTWYVGPDNQGSGLPPGYSVQQAQVTIGNGQAVQTNLVAKLATAHLVGHAMDNGGNPIGGGSMLAFGPNNANVNAQLGNDGSFDLGVTGGSWSISLESQTASSRNLVSPQLSFNVTDGINISNINYVAVISTRTISGWVRNSGSVGISGLNVYANATINSTNFQANTETDASGNYSLQVIPGLWNVGVDSQGLAQRGYGMVFSQSTNTSSGNQVVNFVASLPQTPPTLGGSRLQGQQYQFLLNGSAGQNYTIQFSTNLSAPNWNTLYITNNATSPITVIDSNATNRYRFYRVLVGP